MWEQANLRHNSILAKTTEVDENLRQTSYLNGDLNDKYSVGETLIADIL